MKNRHNSKYNSRHQDHFRFKPAKAAHGKSIGGAARFIRHCYNTGTGKHEAFKMALEKWPKFNHDMVGLESRWRMAKKLAKVHQHA